MMLFIFLVDVDRPNNYSNVKALCLIVSEAASPGQAALMVREAGLLAGLAHDNLLSPLAAFLPGPDSLSSLPLVAYPHLALGNLKRFVFNTTHISVMAHSLHP